MISTIDNQKGPVFLGPPTVILPPFTRANFMGVRMLPGTGFGVGMLISNLVLK